MLGNNLRKLRQNRDLTQLQIADLLKINRVTYTQYELNKREPDNITLSKLADFFDVSVDYLLGRTDNPNANKTMQHPDLSPEDLEFLRKIKDLPPEKRKAIEILAETERQTNPKK